MKTIYAILQLTLFFPYCYILAGNQVGKVDAVRTALYYSSSLAELIQQRQTIQNLQQQVEQLKKQHP